MKKVLALLLAFVICFSFCACKKSDAVSSVAGNSDESEWYLKKTQQTVLDTVAVGGYIKEICEYDSNNKCIQKGSYEEVDGTFEQNQISKYSYDEEGHISSINSCDESGEENTIIFDKHYIDGYCVCSGEVDGGKLAYFYTNDILYKIESYIENEIYSQEIFDERGNTLKKNNSLCSF